MAKSRKRFIAFLPIAVLLGTVSGSAQPAIIEQLGTIETKPPAGHGPTASEWSALANLPDWTGVWTPDIGDQLRQENENNVPWTVEAAAKIQQQIALENAGKPHGTHNTCLPWGMPGFMMLTHNAMEFLFTPGRITIIGEADGNN